ncbi:putative aldehyde dehydrogenase YcbD [Shouchella clausii]|uniref:Aldehyde dehydrogenase n=1 Tax=Shouchella clausii (strain KSM-K16) TaxID=66692 RepID=Q5WJ03_SHOC1|nr:alpha-ketoglutaric semialdehyde dehydrogenase GucD [Shouchella clausii]PAD46381.1 aldehyde dehydrogenase family protein [Shouchella clausii]BAD63652.1 aldehyde dehydrogenase [Shouchella clausii KSM-K16]GIN09246.1 putative aldehyde dehydrogenase YcbD [Shouchella clausii]
MAKFTQTVEVFQNYINGEWKDSTSGQVMDSVNPANKTETIGQLQSSTTEEVDEAIQSATEAKIGWRKTGAYQRGQLLASVANELEKNVDDIAETLTKEMGKTLPEAIGETQRGIAILRYYAAEGMRKEGEVIPASDKEALMFTKRTPLGVVGIITPWNFPVAIPIWKIAPALVYGNTVVFKPASESAVTAAKVVKCFEHAGLPKGVLNFITGKGSIVGEALINSKKLNGITFTGSESTGKRVAKAASANGIKYQLEMGGKNPVIVLDDADVQSAVQGILSGAFKSTGQKCTATSRVIVQEGIYEELKAALLAETKKITIGDGMNSSIWMGPCASESQLNTVLEYIQIGQEEGATLLYGGQRLTENEYAHGFYVEPAIFEQVTSTMRIAQEEIFGPVIALLKVKTVEEAIDIANDTEFGLSASLYTSNIGSALSFIDDIEAGLVRVNSESAGVELQAPFGGMKASSTGTREQGEAAKEFYTAIKTVLIRS